MSTRQGYTIFELLIVLALIGFVIGALLRFFPDRALSDWSVLGDQLNTLAFFAQEQAFTTHKKHRLVFQKKRAHDGVVLEREEPRKKKKEHKYVPVEPTRLSTLLLPTQARWGRIKSENKNLFAEDENNAYIYVSSQGTFDQATVEIEGTFDDLKLKDVFELQQFLGRFMRKPHAS